MADIDMTQEELANARTEFEALAAMAAARQRASRDPCVRGLHTDTEYWMTEEERSRFEELRLVVAHPDFDRAAAARRVQEKRAARRVESRKEREMSDRNVEPGSARALDLDVLERLSAAATKGPWTQGPFYRCDVLGGGRTVRAFGLYTPQDEADAAFIAAARDAVPEMCKELRRLLAGLHTIRERADAVAQYGGSVMELWNMADLLLAGRKE